MWPTHPVDGMDDELEQKGSAKRICEREDMRTSEKRRPAYCPPLMAFYLSLLLLYLPLCCSHYSMFTADTIHLQCSLLTLYT